MSKHLIAAATVIALSCSACPVPEPIRPVVESVIDCFGAKRPQIDALLGEFTPLLMGGTLDWAFVKQRAKHAGRDIGGCFLVELVQKYLGGSRAPEPGGGWEAHETYEEFRKEMDVNEKTIYLTKCIAADGSERECKL